MFWWAQRQALTAPCVMHHERLLMCRTTAAADAATKGSAAAQPRGFHDAPAKGGGHAGESSPAGCAANGQHGDAKRCWC